MFGIGFTEFVAVGVIILLVFGPDKLPEITQKFGKFAGQLKRTSDTVRREFYNAVYTPAEQIKRDINLAQRELMSVKASAEEVTKKSAVSDLSPIQKEDNKTDEQAK